jgi:flagellar motor component MotA
MDILSLIGLAMAFVAIVGGNFLEGGHIGALINGPAALIVFGGTVGAALLQTPINHFKRGLQLLSWAFFPPATNMQNGINSIVGWSMGNLADPSQLGSGIAVAFVATIYGVGISNLVLLPLAGKIKTVVLRHSRYREMLLEGILSIADGENPRSIEIKLQGFLE